MYNWLLYSCFFSIYMYHCKKRTVKSFLIMRVNLNFVDCQNKACSWGSLFVNCQNYAGLWGSVFVDCQNYAGS